MAQHNRTQHEGISQVEYKKQKPKGKCGEGDGEVDEDGAPWECSRR
jgi:hypothetical protein